MSKEYYLQTIKTHFKKQFIFINNLYDLFYGFNGFKLFCLV